MEDNEETKKDMETTAESVEKEEISKVDEVKKEEEKTFTRDEVNKMINAEKQKERQAVLKELKEGGNNKSEAEKLADINEDKTVDALLKRIEATENKLKARDLETETLKQAGDKGIPLELVKTLNFEKETAESIANKLEIFDKATKKERELAISEYSKETPPQTGDYKGTQKSENEMTYEELCNLPKYKN